MSVYSVNKLMEETRKVAANFYKLTGETLPVASELAKYDVMNIMNFQKPEEAESGVDLIATGKWEGQKIQVKSRVLLSTNQSKPMVGQINPNGAWDLIVLVIFDSDYFPGEILMLSRADLDASMNLSNKRGSMSVAKFKNISKCIWMRQTDAPQQSADPA
jgi:hypothetical protein